MWEESRVSPRGFLHKKQHVIQGIPESVLDMIVDMIGHPVKQKISCSQHKTRRFSSQVSLFELDFLSNMASFLMHFSVLQGPGLYPPLIFTRASPLH